MELPELVRQIPTAIARLPPYIIIEIKKWHRYAMGNVGT